MGSHRSSPTEPLKFWNSYDETSFTEITYIGSLISKQIIHKDFKASRSMFWMREFNVTVKFNSFSLDVKNISPENLS